MSEGKSLPRSVSVKVFYDSKLQTVKVEKLPLGKGVALSGALKSIPKRLQELQSNDEVRAAWDKAAQGEVGVVEVGAQIIEILPELLEGALDLILDVLEIGTGLERSTLVQVGFDEASDLLVAVLTVNNVGKVVQNAKNLRTLLAGN